MIRWILAGILGQKKVFGENSTFCLGRFGGFWFCPDRPGVPFLNRPWICNLKRFHLKEELIFSSMNYIICYISRYYIIYYIIPNYITVLTPTSILNIFYGFLKKFQNSGQKLGRSLEGLDWSGRYLDYFLWREPVIEHYRKLDILRKSQLCNIGGP